MGDSTPVQHIPQVNGSLVTFHESVVVKQLVWKYLHLVLVAFNRASQLLGILCLCLFYVKKT